MQTLHSRKFELKMSAPRNTRHKSRSVRAWLGLAALLCLPLLEAAHPFLYYANHARRGYGRNIQPLPCATKKGETGVCMFAWDCMKAKGTHLGTCIERFYFGSCCKLKPGSKKPQHTVMKTDVYILATTIQPQTAAPDASSSPSTPQTGSNLLGMITGQTTLTSDTSTLRTTLLTSGDLEEPLGGFQEVQQVFDTGAQETDAQSTSSVDLDMEAIEQQMAEDGDVQGIKQEEDNKIQPDSDLELENQDQSQVNDGDSEVQEDKITSAQIFEQSESESSASEQNFKDTVQLQTDAPTQSIVEESSFVTDESLATTNQVGDQSEKNQETNDENEITNIQEQDDAQVILEQNEVDGEQEVAVEDDGTSGQDQSQDSASDQQSDIITPEILSQVLEMASDPDQVAASQGIGVGVGTVTSVELDYVSSATEASTVQSDGGQGQTTIVNETDSDHTEDEISATSFVTPTIQEITAGQSFGPDSTRESSSPENELGGAESPMESSTAAGSGTSISSVEEPTGVTESSNEITENEGSETVPTTEAISLMTGDNDSQSVSSEQIESGVISETETSLAADAATEKPLDSAGPSETASHPSASSDSTVSSVGSDDGSLTTIAPQQTDSTVLPESTGFENSSDSVLIGTSDDLSAGESTEKPTVEVVALDSAVEGPDDAKEEGEDPLVVETGSTSDEVGSFSGDDAGITESSSDVDAGVSTNVSGSEVQATSDVDSSSPSADGISSTPDGSIMQTPDADASQSPSSTESAIEGDKPTSEENVSTKDENNVTDTSTSLPSLGENVIVPGVQIVPAPESGKNESTIVSSAESVDEDVPSGVPGDSTTEIPQENVSTDAPSIGSGSEEISSTDESPVKDTVDSQSSSAEVSRPDEPETVVEGISAVLPNETAQPEQQFETQEEQLLHRLKNSSFKEVCGQPVYPSRRIVGGSQASFGEWPWQVSLRQWRSVTYLHKCGAALVNENWAITAAHCVENVLPDQLLLRLGEFDLERADEPYGHVERKVQIIATHPQFDPRTFEYDLALLRFNEPVTFQPNIIPICIPDDDYDFIGDTGFVSGWGRLYEDGPLPSLMQKVPVPVITNGECEIMYRNAGYIEDIPNIFICAGYEGGKRDSCEGDSGGPLVIQHKNSWKLAGVISWGIGCALPNQPGVYTRISAFREWINKIIVF